MDCLQKLFALKASYPHDIILYPQDIKNLMKLPGRILGNFDSQLLDFLKLTNGASILDYCFYGFENNKLKIGFDENLMNKWVTFGHIAGSVVPFMSNSSGVNFGYLKDIIINGSHPIVFFNQFKEDTLIIASSFESFLRSFLDRIEESVLNGNSVEIEEIGWPSDSKYWQIMDPHIDKVLALDNVKRILKNIKS